MQSTPLFAAVQDCFRTNTEELLSKQDPSLFDRGFLLQKGSLNTIYLPEPRARVGEKATEYLLLNAMCQEGHEAIVSLLLKNNAEPNHAAWSNQLMVAIRTKAFCHALNAAR